MECPSYTCTVTIFFMSWVHKTMTCFLPQVIFIWTGVKSESLVDLGAWVKFKLFYDFLLVITTLYEYGMTF